MSTSLLRTAVEYRMKIRRHEEEQRHAPSQQNQPPSPHIIPPDEALRALHLAEGSPDPDAALGKPQRVVTNRQLSSPLAELKERLHRDTMSHFTVDKYNPPVTRPPQNFSVASLACLSSANTTGTTSLNGADTESQSCVGVCANKVPTPKSSQLLAIPICGARSEEKEKEEQRIEAFYEAVSRNLPRGTIYVTYLSRLPPDWRRPLYHCGGDDCAFHNDVNVGKVYKFAQERERERAMDLTERRMLAPPKIKFRSQLYTHYTVKTASNLHTAEPQLAYPSAMADCTKFQPCGEAPDTKNLSGGNGGKLWHDESDSDDDTGTEDTGYETDLSTYTNRSAKAPIRVAVTRVVPRLKQKKSIIMRHFLRHKYSQSVASRGADLNCDVVFGDDDDDDTFDRHG